MQILEKENAGIKRLENIYSEYRNFMLSIARTYIDDTQICEDVFHNAFNSLIRNKEIVTQLSPPKLKAYILLAVRHACIDYLRKERKIQLLDVPDDALIDILMKSKDGLSKFEMPFQMVEFYSLLRQLSAEDQTLLIGSYIVGLDSEELAQILDCKSGNVRVKLHRAKKRALAMFSALGLRMEDFLL